MPTTNQQVEEMALQGLMAKYPPIRAALLRLARLESERDALAGELERAECLFKSHKNALEKVQSERDTLAERSSLETARLREALEEVAERTICTTMQPVVLQARLKQIGKAARQALKEKP